MHDAEQLGQRQAGQAEQLNDATGDLFMLRTSYTATQSNLLAHTSTYAHICE